MDKDNIRGMTCEEMLQYAKQHPGEHIYNTSLSGYIYYRKAYDIAKEEEVEGFFDHDGCRIKITTAFAARAIYFPDKWYAESHIRSAKTCRYQVQIPEVGCCCKNHHRNGNSYYFPPCSCKSCPFVHPIYRDYGGRPLYAWEVYSRDAFYRPTW